MTPAEHYREAEKLAAESEKHVRSIGRMPSPTMTGTLHRAQILAELAGVHARLAAVDPQTAAQAHRTDEPEPGVQATLQGLSPVCATAGVHDWPPLSAAKVGDIDTCGNCGAVRTIMRGGKPVYTYTGGSDG